MVVTARRANELDALVAEIERQGGTALAVPVDVTDQQAVIDGIAMDLPNHNLFVAFAGPDVDDEEEGATIYIQAVDGNNRLPIVGSNETRDILIMADGETRTRIITTYDDGGVGVEEL